MPQEFAFPNTEASVWLARTDCFLIVKLKGTQMRNDPRQITARFGKCAKCGNDVKGKTVIYWPLNHKVFCMPCGETDYRESLSAIQDEDMFSR